MSEIADLIDGNSARRLKLIAKRCEDGGDGVEN